VDHKDTKQKNFNSRTAAKKRPHPLAAVACMGFDMQRSGLPAFIADVTPLDRLFLLNCHLVKLFYGPYIHINFHLGNYSFTNEIL